MTILQAFHNDPKIKTKYVNRVKAHAKADEIIQGVYWQNGKGCAVGCTVEQSANPHGVMEDEIGVPVTLAYLEDEIFEGLSNGEAKKFPLRFLQAIKPGADLILVTARFVVWQFEDPIYGLSQIDEVKDDAELMSVCTDLVTLYKRKLDGGEVTDQEWEDLYERAWARAGARAGAGAGARAGAWAWARAGAWAGARAGAWAWTRAYNETSYWTAAANKLIELLEEAE